MHRRQTTAALLASAASLTVASLCLTLPATASTALTAVVSQTPESWTPNVSAGPPPSGQNAGCNTTFFGSGSISCVSEVYDTAYVNGDIVAVGSFTQVCQAGSGAGHCVAGTTVTRDDIFAYSPVTGVIDPNFVPVLDAGPAWTVVAGPAGSNTVYVGGAFTMVNGVSQRGLIELNVTPGVTSTDGTVVTTFVASVSNQVRSLALSPDGTALYVGGQFTVVDGESTFGPGGPKVQSLARLSAATGTVDNTFAYTLSDPLKGEATQIEAMTLSPDGNHLAFAGTAQQVNGVSRPRLAIVDTGGTFGASSSLAAFMAPILKNNCSAEHDYVQGIDFSPDNSFVVIADTGAKSDGSTPYAVCDAAARFDVNATDTAPTGTVDVAPAWINYAGGDSFYAIAIAGGVVYTGGHNRWVNNYCGYNFVCDANGLLVAGLAALDANTGVALPWFHPLTLRGHGTTYVATFPAGTYDGPNAGLIQGTDVNSIAGAYHSEEAIFPVAAASSPTPGGPIPSGMFNEEGGASTKPPTCLDDLGDSSTPGTAVESTTCSNDPEQNWNIETNNTIQINNLCLDTLGSATANDTEVVVNGCTGGLTQEWIQGTGNTLVNQGATNECLTAPGGKVTSGTVLQIQTCRTATSQVWPLPAAPGPPAGPPVGEIYPELTQTSAQVPCLDNVGNSAELETCTGAPEQRSILNTNGTIQIDGNHCLDSSAPLQTGTVNAVLNPCSGATTQQWTVGPNYELVNTGVTALNGASYCLVDPGSNTVNGAQLQISACASGDNYAWRLPAV